MSTTLDDFDTQANGLLKGAHGQQIIDAIRALNNQEGYDTSKPHPYWDFAEMWPGVIVGTWHEVTKYTVGAVQPAQYCVRKCYVGGAKTEAPLRIYNATDDPKQYYCATNLLENGAFTNQVQPGTQILVIALIDRGITNRKRYVFLADRPVLWMKITSAIDPSTVGPPPLGGGGYYNARSVAKAPVTLDPTTNLIAPISPNETVASTDDILAVNWYEANLGNPPSHIVQCPTFVPGWLIGYSNETTPRPVYRFYIPKSGIASLSIGFPGSFSGEVVALGTGRYYAAVMLGSALNQDVTTPFGTDNGTDYGVTGTCIWQNQAEALQPALAFSPHAMIAFGRDSMVTGNFEGSTLVTISGVPTIIPVYYGWATLALFPVDVYAVSGTGTVVDPFVYDVYAYGSLPPDPNYKLAAGQTPTERPFPACAVTAATHGMAWQRNGGVGVSLWFVYEQPSGTPLNGTYVISASLGGSVVYNGGTAIEPWTPAL